MPPEVDRLLALGREIATFRARLGIAEPYPLQARLLALRGRTLSRNDLGEPRLARAWLDALEA